MSHTPEWESLGFVLGSRPKQVVWQHTSGLQVIANFDEYKQTDALLNSHDRLTAEVGRLREALETAIDWIRNAPEDTWGEGSNSEGMRWPIRDELADKLCKALNPEEPK